MITCKANCFALFLLFSFRNSNFPFLFQWLDLDFISHTQFSTIYLFVFIMQLYIYSLRFLKDFSTRISAKPYTRTTVILTLFQNRRARRIEFASQNVHIINFFGTVVGKSCQRFFSKNIAGLTGFRKIISKLTQGNLIHA